MPADACKCRSDRCVGIVSSGRAWEVAVLAPVSACSGRPRPGFCHQIEVLQAAVDTVRIDVRGRPTGISLEVGVAPCEDGAGDPNEQRMLDRAHVAAMVGPWPARPAGTLDAPPPHGHLVAPEMGEDERAIIDEGIAAVLARHETPQQ